MTWLLRAVLAVLVLLTLLGDWSSGKRTLISAFIDLINRTRRDHVISIESEINVVFERGVSFVSQREVRGDSDEVLECQSEVRDDLPLPGALWFLPPIDELWLDGYRSLPVTSGRVLVTYEVHYRPTGTGEERMFHTGSELVRVRGEWRIARPIGEASMPEWKPVPGPVDM